MAKKVTNIEVKDATVRTIKHEGEDFVCITDIARQKNSSDPNGVIANWMRNRNTIEFLGIWEQLFNPCFNPLEFEGFRKEAGLNAFTMSPSRWIESTNAKGLVAMAGRYGGTYARTDMNLHLGFLWNSNFISSRNSSVSRKKNRNKLDGRSNVNSQSSTIVFIPMP